MKKIKFSKRELFVLINYYNFQLLYRHNQQIYNSMKDLIKLNEKLKNIGESLEDVLSYKDELDLHELKTIKLIQKKVKEIKNSIINKKIAHQMLIEMVDVDGNNVKTIKYTIDFLKEWLERKSLNDLFNFIIKISDLTYKINVTVQNYQLNTLSFISLSLDKVNYYINNDLLDTVLRYEVNLIQKS